MELGLLVPQTKDVTRLSWVLQLVIPPSSDRAPGAHKMQESPQISDAESLETGPGHQ